MFKQTLSISALCLAILVSMGLSQSQAQVKRKRIGYVNPQAILQKMPESKAVQQKLQNYVDKKRKELSQQQQNLQQQVSDYQDRQSVMSKEAQKKEEKRLGNKQADLQKAQRKAQQEIQQKQQELIAPLKESIDKSIKNVASNMNLSYVLNTTTTQGDLIILYASDEAKQKYDITSEVMNDLGIDN